MGRDRQVGTQRQNLGGQEAARAAPWDGVAGLTARVLGAHSVRTCVLPTPFLAAALLFLATNLVGSTELLSSCRRAGQGRGTANAEQTKLEGARAGGLDWQQARGVQWRS